MTTDGRQLRRERNREAVVEALLDLYRDGNLQPSSEEIAARSGLSPAPSSGTSTTSTI